LGLAGSYFGSSGSLGEASGLVSGFASAVALLLVLGAALSELAGVSGGA
jgi:hypothetical protein